MGTTSCDEAEARVGLRVAALLVIADDLLKVSKTVEHGDDASDRQLSLLVDGVDWLRKRLERNQKAGNVEPVS